MIRFNSERGSSMVECALIMPLLLVFLLGIIEGGRLFSIWLTLEHQTQEAARLGAVAVGDPGRALTLATAVTDRSTFGLQKITIDPARLETLVTVGTEPGGMVSVELRYAMDFVTPLMQQLMGPNLVLHARSSMRVE